MDITLLQGAVTSLQTAFKISKALVELKSEADIQMKTIELRDAIITAQQGTAAALTEQLAMIERVHQLEKEIADIKAWEETKQRYQLISSWPGCFVYALKETSKGSDPAHWICEHCYQDRRQSILQIMQNQDRRISNILKCSHCTFQISMPNNQLRPAYVKEIMSKEG